MYVQHVHHLVREKNERDRPETIKHCNNTYEEGEERREERERNRERAREEKKDRERERERKKERELEKMKQKESHGENRVGEDRIGRKPRDRRTEIQIRGRRRPKSATRHSRGGDSSITLRC